MWGLNRTQVWVIKVGFTPNVPVFFWPGWHNFRDIEIKFCVFTTFVPLISHQILKLGFKKYKFSLIINLLIKFMDFLNMTKKALIHAFYKKVNQRKSLSFKPHI